MASGGLDTFGRWLWGAVCLGLGIVAFWSGGFLLVCFVAIALLIYAVLFATVATALRSKGSSTEGDGNNASPMFTRFAANFRKALVDGPIFVLGYWQRLLSTQSRHSSDGNLSAAFGTNASTRKISHPPPSELFAEQATAHSTVTQNPRGFESNAAAPALVRSYFCWGD